MLLFLLVLLVPSSMGQNCSERCCYWYKQVSRNYSDCHVSHNGTVVLTCEVYAPRDSSNNSLATVKRYRNNESVIENVTDRYENSKTSTKNKFNSSNTSMNGLFEDRYQLIIRNVNSSDSGVYWCRLSADRFCFIPSAYVNITFNTSSGYLEYNYQQSPVCAVDNSPSCQVISTSLIQTVSSTPLSVSTPSIAPTQLELCHGDLNVTNLGFLACLGVTVPAAGFTLILMIILICCAGICICWRKKTRRKAVQSVAQTEIDHTSDRSNAQVVGLKRRKAHQYEDVENPRPDEHTAEEPVSDRERTLDHEYSELEHEEKPIPSKK